MNDDLRDQIANVISDHATPRAVHPWTVGNMADAVLALPAIADAVALAELCAPLTVEQVARALELAAQSIDVGWFPTDDEKAIASWEDKR